MGGGEVKVATVDVESGDNMATLPVSRSHTTGSNDSAEKNNAANKEMELKNVMPQPLQRLISQFYYFFDKLCVKCRLKNYIYKNYIKEKNAP